MYKHHRSLWERRKKTTSRGYAIVKDAAKRRCEINMYGEVVQDRPRNWWTDEKDDDSYIVLTEFLSELNELKTYDEVEVHINSVGGDAFAGLAIHNRLKELSGNVITINDSLAASAGSIILQGGKVRKVRKASSTMVHNALTLLWGYYDDSDLNKVLSKLDAVNKSLAEAYIAHGIDSEAVRSDMSATTWMTGEEAVAKGYADEVIEDGEELGVAMAIDRSYMIDKGHRLCAMWMPDELPEGIDIVDSSKEQSAVEQTEDKFNEGGISGMEITNIEQLCAAYPELTNQLSAQAQASERERIRDISAIAGNVTDSELVNSALYGEERMSAKDFAFAAMTRGAIGKQKQSATANMLNALDADNAASNANNVQAATNSAQRDGTNDPTQMPQDQINNYARSLYE